MTEDTDGLVAALRSRVDGQVLTTGQDGHDKARTTHFPVRIGVPVAVVRPRHSGDVAATVQVAGRTGTGLFVRSGGHSGAAHSTGDGILLDLSSLAGIDIDVTSRTARADAGLSAEAVTTCSPPRSSPRTVGSAPSTPHTSRTCSGRSVAGAATSVSSPGSASGWRRCRSSTVDPEAGQQALRPLRTLGTPIADLVQPMPFPALYEEDAPYKGYVPAIRTMFVDRVDEAVAATML